jgi:hypothetical protein
MKKLLLIFIFSASGITAFSQSLQPTVVGSAGASGTSASGNIDWTIGEIMTETFAGGNYLTQGFHQPLNPLSTAVTEQNSWNGAVYPNPVSESLNLDFPAGANGSYTVELYDAMGKKILSKNYEISGLSHVTLPFEQLGSGVYHIRMYNSSGTSMQVFTVQKIK